jgi:hypothetical protein
LIASLVEASLRLLSPLQVYSSALALQMKPLWVNYGLVMALVESPTDLLIWLFHVKRLSSWSVVEDMCHSQYIQYSGTPFV